MVAGDIFDTLAKWDPEMVRFGVATSVALVGGAAGSAYRWVQRTQLPSKTATIAGIASGASAYAFDLMPAGYPAPSAQEGLAGLLGSAVVGGGIGFGVSCAGFALYDAYRHRTLDWQSIRKRSILTGSACALASMSAYICIRRAYHPFDF